MADPAPMIVLASGGTGGHMLPAVAVARALHKRGAEAIITSDARAVHHGVNAGIETVEIPSSQMLPGLAGKARTALTIARGTWAARHVLKQRKADAVMGFGSYASLPTCFAARVCGLPLMLHAQDAVIGRANRLLAPNACLITSNFPTMEKMPGESRNMIVQTGNPVRADIAALREQPIPEISDSGPISILVVGGSQGAKVFASVIPAALSVLPEQIRARVQLSLQVPEAEVEQTKTELDKLDLAGATVSHFFTDMAERIGAAHLVIGRAGATFAELCLAGRAAIYVPLPTSMDNHQAINATMLQQAGCGWHMPESDLTAESLAAKLEQLFTDPAQIMTAARQARQFQQPDAADRVAEAILDTLASLQTSPAT
ncbi:MAG: undecaprenyldiphospho-muramoylpentapeptide beta-N-acetylglucosaminyltransferase [Alphaproteobacteria bacterium]